MKRHINRRSLSIGVVLVGLLYQLHSPLGETVAGEPTRYVDGTQTGQLDRRYLPPLPFHPRPDNSSIGNMPGARGQVPTMPPLRDHLQGTWEKAPVVNPASFDDPSSSLSPTPVEASLTDTDGSERATSHPERTSEVAVPAEIRGQRHLGIPWRCCYQQSRYGQKPEPRVLGDLIRAHRAVHVSKGHSAQMVLYDYDFVEDTANLKHRGRQRLGVIMGLVARSFSPIIIEETPYRPHLAETRRRAVLQELANAPIPVPEQRVRIGLPPTPGLDGKDAAFIESNLRMQTEQRGSRLGGLSAAATSETEGEE